MRTKTARILALVALLAIPLSISAQHDGTIDDRDVQVADFPNPIYPQIAATAHVEGVVVVRVSLDDQGKVAKAEALSGPGLLIRASLDNARQWRFEANSHNPAMYTTSVSKAFTTATAPRTASSSTLPT